MEEERTEAIFEVIDIWLSLSCQTVKKELLVPQQPAGWRSQ